MSSYRDFPATRGAQCRSAEHAPTVTAVALQRRLLAQQVERLDLVTVARGLRTHEKEGEHEQQDRPKRDAHVTQDQFHPQGYV